MADRKPVTNLADPSAALVSYLDDLLHTATSTVTETVEEPEVPEAEQSEFQTLADEARTCPRKSQSRNRHRLLSSRSRRWSQSR